MTDKLRERVLVTPTAEFHKLGVFQGFTPDYEKYMPLLLDAKHLSYRPRSEMEEDPSFKQIIPYVVLKCGDEIFHYTRGKKATESRLQELRSIGVGGHISEGDGTFFDSPYRDAMFRELQEEVHIDSPYAERTVGLINDDSTAVGQVHLGIVHVLELAKPKVTRREQALTRAGFAPLSELRRHKEEFETWSQFVLELDL